MLWSFEWLLCLAKEKRVCVLWGRSEEGVQFWINHMKIRLCSWCHCHQQQHQRPNASTTVTTTQFIQNNKSLFHFCIQWQHKFNTCNKRIMGWWGSYHSFHIWSLVPCMITHILVDQPAWQTKGKTMSLSNACLYYGVMEQECHDSELPCVVGALLMEIPIRRQDFR